MLRRNPCTAVPVATPQRQRACAVTYYERETMGLLLLARLITSVAAHHLTGSEVGAKICGAELEAMYSGAEVPTT